MSTQQPHILLVEDHPFQLIAMQILLNNHGFLRLTSALDANEALRIMARAEHIDVLLCDQCLPGMTGLKLIETASQRGWIDRAILLSSLAQEELQALHHQALQQNLPMLGYLSKPLDTHALALLLALPR